MQVPIVLLGGNLRLHEFGFKSCHNTGILYISPKTGRRIIFRGDMAHSISRAYSDKKTARVGIVFEQYNIPEDRLNEVNFRYVGYSI